MNRHNVRKANYLLDQIIEMEEMLELKNWLDGGRYTLRLYNHASIQDLPDHIISECRIVIQNYCNKRLSELEKLLEELD